MRGLVVLLLGTALAGCSLAPDYARPQAPVPESLPTGDAYLRQSEEALPTVTYRDVFRDPRLLRLIGQALENNRDLRIAAANLAEARAQVRVTRAAQFPALAVGASTDYRDQGVQEGQTYALQGGISNFELDLFGRLANATAAQRERALATEAAARTVRIGLVGDIASTWATYAADRDLLEIAQETASNARRSVELTRARLEGGIAPRTDLRQAEQVLATAEGDLAQQTAALAEDINLMQLLVGAPFDRALLPSGLGEIAETIATLPAGTSSDVLLRRPDVIQAEYLLRAANADIGVARAALFPSISLTGLLGAASGALGDLFTGDAFGVTATASASATVFDAGGRRANVAATQARRDAALASYERAIQTAFREVSDALATQGTIGDRLAAARRNTDAAADTARLTEARYRGGVDSFLANLVAQRSLYTARRSEVAVALIGLQSRIELYRVLGGDAELASPATEPPLPVAEP
ncbi:transporter [Altererythrobacter sp. B11]|uniref:efflux transporter outer membrane subunit n=1 Tax=Altererythrobacter sp. B11 TaxID=2060312 RepID=UPI000DC73DFE|nr:efflux transporter outer membrane subunit [Altererythrobacter sp. B11]BBC72030.1 transporter [Altererythrobacter sp. B11]